MKNYFIILLCLAAKISIAQTPPKVLGAYAHTIGYGNVYALSDSGTLNYDSGFSYDAKNKLYQYDTIYGYTFVSGPGYINSYIVVGNYDTAKNMLNNIAYKKNSSGAWIDSFKNTYSYNANNLIETATRQSFDEALGTWNNIDKYIYSYDSLGNTTNRIYQRWDVPSKGWTNRYQTLYSYDTNRNLIVYDHGSWDSLHGYIYTHDTNIKYQYDVLNRLTYAWVNTSTSPFSAPGFIYRFEYVYDPVTFDLKIKYRDYPYPSYVLYYDYYYYTYDANHNLKEEEQKYHYLNDYTYDSVHNMTSIQSNTAPAPPPLMYKSDSRTYFTYNTDKQVTSYRYETWNDTIFKWRPINYDRYYYITPPPPPVIKTSVPVIEQDKGFVQVYPNPAHDIINIDLKFEKEETALALIYDQQGRLYMQWLISTAMFSHSSVPIDRLSPGNYILSIKTEGSSISKIFSVIR